MSKGLKHHPWTTKNTSRSASTHLRGHRRKFASERLQDAHRLLLPCRERHRFKPFRKSLEGTHLSSALAAISGGRQRNISTRAACVGKASYSQGVVGMPWVRLQYHPLTQDVIPSQDAKTHKNLRILRRG
ncbi:hypothetical protein OH77DRAFT_1094431 [Trametes cingulata]|nr:hypothetical protein OH77DRAFT_1094431 [Trametes cingulata]